MILKIWLAFKWYFTFQPEFNIKNKNRSISRFKVYNHLIIHYSKKYRQQRLSVSIFWAKISNWKHPECPFVSCCICKKIFFKSQSCWRYCQIYIFFSYLQFKKEKLTKEYLFDNSLAKCHKFWLCTSLQCFCTFQRTPSL